MSGLVDNIRASLLGLKMRRAMEMLDHMVQWLEKGEIGAIEAIDSLLSEEINCREDRRVGVALTTARLTPPKTLESYDFTFQPSLNPDGIIALTTTYSAVGRCRSSSKSTEFVALNAAISGVATASSATSAVMSTYCSVFRLP